MVTTSVSIREQAKVALTFVDLRLTPRSEMSRSSWSDKDAVTQPLQRRFRTLAFITLVVSVFRFVPTLITGASAGEVHATPVSPHVVATAVRIERSSGTAKIVFDLSSAVDVQTFVLENPDRVVVETSEVDFRINPDVGRLKTGAGSLVKAFRFGTFDKGKSRVVIDLGAPARVQKTVVTPAAGADPSRMTLQIVKCDRASFHQSADMAAAQQVRPEAVPDADVADAGALPVIVIDPGHGGVDPGATGIGGVVEKQLVFDFGAALATKLRASGHFKVLMTRDDDVFVSLRDRMAVARDAKAALLVSIHADTVADGNSVTGATVYTTSERASDAEAARVAEKENKADQQAGVEPAPDTTEVSDILFDLTRKETRVFSHSFQHTLAGYWQKVARLNKNPERSAGFMVLKAPDVPSVLLELGYLSSDKDVAALISPEWRDRATDAVAASIGSFFADRHLPPRTIGAQLDLPAADGDRTAVVSLRPHL